MLMLTRCCAALAGGIAVTLVGHPFDTAKVRLQTQSARNPIYCKCRLSCCCSPVLVTAAVTHVRLTASHAAGVFDVVRKTIQWEGPQGLYKVRCKHAAYACRYKALQAHPRRV